MAINMNIQGVKPSKLTHNWFNTTIDTENIIKDAIFSCFNDFNPSFEDYVGISHQVQAIELGYTDF